MNMIPRSPNHDAPDSAFGYAELPCHGAHRIVGPFVCTFRDIGIFDPSDLFFSKNSRMMSNAAHAWAFPSPPLVRHISQIVGLCAKKQVFRIYAWAVVALVQYAQSIWDNTSVNYPRKSMRTDPALSYCKTPISRRCCASPFPAPFGFLEEFLKSLFHVPDFSHNNSVYTLLSKDKRKCR